MLQNVTECYKTIVTLFFNCYMVEIGAVTELFLKTLFKMGIGFCVFLSILTSMAIAPCNILYYTILLIPCQYINIFYYIFFIP